MVCFRFCAVAAAWIAVQATSVADAPVWVHAGMLPAEVVLPARTNAWLFLEGEPAGLGDAWPDRSREPRTIFRSEQEPDDKWWGTERAFDGSRLAVRGDDRDHPWHRLGWALPAEALEPGLYDVHARIMVSPGGSCELAFTVDGARPERTTLHDRQGLGWVGVGSAELLAGIRQASLFLRTRKSAVRVDTVLLVKVAPTVAQTDFRRIRLTPPAWEKGDGLVFTNSTAVIGFASDTPDRIRKVETAVRWRPDAPFVFTNTLAASDGTWRVTLPHPGWHDIRVKVTPAHGKTIIREARAAVLGKPIREDWRRQSVFGLWSVHGEPTLIRLAGARWDRRMVSFSGVTPEAAAAAREAAEPVEPYYTRDGLDHIGVFAFGMPLWTMDVPTHAARPGYGNPFYPAKNWDEVAASVTAFARQRALPARFSMYNEPLAHWKGTHAELVDYARAVRKGLKAASPDFLIGGPGLYSIRPGDLDKLAEAGLLDVLDFIDMHAYVGGTPPETDFLTNIKTLKDWLQARGQSAKPVYLTEFGWTAAAGTWQPHVDRRTQAAYVARSLALGWSQGVDALIYFTLDYRTRNPGEAAFSLIDPEGRPEPGYVAFATVSKWFAAAEPLGHILLTPTAHMVIGRRGETLQLAVWSTAGPETIRLPFAVTRGVSLFGEPVAITEALTAGPEPVFLEASAAGFAGLTVLPEITGTHPADVGATALFWPAAGMISAPATLRSGRYAAFSESNGRWFVHPFEKVAPSHVASAGFEWPVAAADPRLAVRLQSNVGDRTLVETVWRADRPYRRAVVELPPNGAREIHFPLPDTVPGRRRETRIILESADGRRLTHSLEWTALAAWPLGRPGDWTEFTDWAPFGVLANTDDFNDCRGWLRLLHGTDGITLHVRVADEEHHQEKVPPTPEEAWKHDSIQIGFDLDILKPWEAGFAGADSSRTLGGHRVFEFTVAGWAEGDTPAGVAYLQRSYDETLPAGTVRRAVRAHVSREGGETRYTVRFPWPELGAAAPPGPGSVIGFSLVVNDVDPARSASRHGLRLFDGIVHDKDPKQFGPVWLR